MNSQTLLSNVFVPTYTFDTIANTFVAKLNISNVNTLNATSISISTANICDTESNVYIGSNAGNSVDFPRDCVDNVAVGTNAGYSISNVSNSVYIGHAAGQSTTSASNVIAIGSGAIGGGTNTIAIGGGTGVAGGSNNILIGQSISNTTLCNQLNIGNTLYGNISNGNVGVGLSNPSYRLDVSGTSRFGNIGVNMAPSATSMSVSGSVNISGSISASGLVDASGYRCFTGNVSLQMAGPTYLNGHVWKKGINILTATDVDANANYFYGLFFVRNTTGDRLALNEVGVGISCPSSGATMTLQSLSNDRPNVNYSITYFPLS